MPFLLVFTVLLPMVGSLTLLLNPKLPAHRARSIALAYTLVTMALTAILALAFSATQAGPQFAFGSSGKYGLEWMPQYGVRFAFGLDGLSLGLFALTSLLLITAVFSSWESVTERTPTHYALLLALQTGLLGLFSSLDVVLFYIFFEFTLIPLFFLIGLFGGPERRRASVTFFLYTLAGSLLTLLGVIGLVAVHYQHSHVLTFSIPELTEGLANLQWTPWHERPVWGGWHIFSTSFPYFHPLALGDQLSQISNYLRTPQLAIFMLLFAGFAIKVPLFPFHTWLPLAHVEAPTAGSILLAGVMLKVGSYGFLRFNMAMTPDASIALYPLMATLAVIGILYGALAALAQTDVKRLVAYSSVSHMGFIILGLFSLNATGMEGGTIQMINHGLTTGALFACVGVIYERYHTREMSELGGLWDRLPVWAFMFILASMGSAALPLLNGFVGEFPILVGAYALDPKFAIAASIGMILGAYYLLWMLQRVVFGPLKEPKVHDSHGKGDDHGHASVRPVGWHEIAGISPLLFFIVVIGLFPKPFLDRIKTPLKPIVGLVDPNKPAFQVKPLPGTPAKIVPGPKPIGIANPRG